MVRIRPGRSWRLNPGYLERLRALAKPQATRFDATAILDVVGIEIDGVDIAAGVGEAQVLCAVAELAEALVRLGEGAPAAQATVGPGPTEVLLEARGSDVLLALLRLSRPAKVLAAGLLVDGPRLRAAALQAVRGLLDDLLGISEALADAPVAKRLKRAALALRKKPAPAKAWPPPRENAAALLLKSGPQALRCEVQVPPEETDRLAAPVPGGELASLLARGSLTLRVPQAPAVSVDGAAFLMLRDAVAAGEALVHAWEAGERTFTLALGNAELEVDLTRDELRAAGWTRAAPAGPAQVSAAIASAAKTFALRAARLAQGRHRLEALDDLRDSAAALLRHCRDLESGALRRHPEIVAAPPARRAPAREERPLQPLGRVRRLVFRPAWTLRLPAEPSALHVFGRDGAAGRGAVVAVLPNEAVAHDVEAGQRLWALPCAGPRALARAPGGTDAFVLGPDALVALDATTGETRWKRKMAAGPGPAALAFAVPGGVLASVRGALALVSDGGAVSWRARLEDAPLGVLAHEATLLLVLPGGVLAALDLQTGRALWRRRVGVDAASPVLCGQRLLVAAPHAAGGSARIVALDPHSGAPAWEWPVPAATRSQPTFAAAGELVAVTAGARIYGLRTADGAERWSAELPWSGQSAVAVRDDAEDAGRSGHRRARKPVVFAAGPGGAAAAFDRLGAPAWTAPKNGDGPPSAPRLARGLLLLGSTHLSVFDSGEGIPVASLDAGDGAVWTASADLTVAMHAGGELRALRLATHLSVV